MSFTEAIFLSASVPDASRAPEYARTADSVAITSAVSALLFVTLGRRPLVWGGHPAITPMVWAVSSAMDVDYGAWVRLYQSLHWRDEFPEDNERFQNVSHTPDEGTVDRSLLTMRRRMFSDHKFTAAVFIGGMSGVIDEYNLFREIQPEAICIPLASTGGATATLSRSEDYALQDELNYASFLHDRLGVSPLENRYRVPSEQPKHVRARLRQPPKDRSPVA